MSENKTAKTPADGPVAWGCQCGRAYTVTCISSKPAKQEPVAFCNGMPAYEGSLSKAQRLTQDLEAPLTINGVPLYPKKQWVGLTDEDRNNLWRNIIGWGDPSHDDEDLMKAIEAKLQEKNT